MTSLLMREQDLDTGIKRPCVKTVELSVVDNSLYVSARATCKI